MHPEPIVDFGIVLAAGGSSRMGHPKALLQLNGQALVNAHINALRTHCLELLVVLGSQADAIASVLDEDIKVVHNTQWKETHMADSLRIALKHCSGRAIVTPIDCEPVPTSVLERLCQTRAPAVTQYEGQDGHPVLIDVRQVLKSEGTLQDLLSGAQRVPGWPGALHNWNTPEEWGAYSSPSRSGRN